MARKRDYRAEYRRRLERAQRLGYSTRIARGHAAKSEYGLREAAKSGKQVGQSKIRATGREVSKETFERSIEELRSFGITERRLRGIDIHDEQSFIKMLLDSGFTPREAYTLRFSP
jgi:hypothetical protein